MPPPLRVLIADDSALVRQRLQAQLAEMEGIELTGLYSNPLEAIQGIRQQRPDVAILDIRMRGGSGMQVLKAIRQEAPALKVIMLTAFPFPQYRTRYIAEGADYFFDKTGEFDRVYDLLREWACTETKP